MQAPKTITITGTGTAQALSTSHLGARWIQFYAKSTNAADALVGGDKSNAPAYPVPKGTSVPYFPNGVEPMGFYFLDEVYVNPGSSDILYVLYGG